MRFHIFNALFASRFRSLNETDGMPEWKAEIERDNVDADIMREAINALYDKHQRLSSGGEKYLAAPRLPEVMGTYRQIEASKKVYVPPSYTCPRCGNSGWAMGLKTMDGYWIDPMHPKRVGRTLYHSLIACKCELGRVATITAELPKGAPQAVRDGLARYCCLPMGIVGQDDQRDMTYLRELQAECEATL